MGKLRRNLLIAMAAVAAIGIGGGVVALRTYDKATKIDRTVSKVVVREYIDAVLVRRDEDRAALFRCSEAGGLDAFNAMQGQLAAEEASSGYSTQVVISRSLEGVGGRSVDVELQLNQGSGTEVRTRLQHWRFTMVDEGGWRVCGAEQLPDPSPSISPSATPPTAG